MDTQTALSILGLAANASLEEAKAAFRSRAKACHPDTIHHGRISEAEAESAMKEINRAYRALSQVLPRSVDTTAAGQPSPAAGPPRKSPARSTAPESGSTGVADWLKSVIRSRKRKPRHGHPAPTNRRPSPGKPSPRFNTLFQEAVSGSSGQGTARTPGASRSGPRKTGFRKPFDYAAYMKMKKTMRQRRRFMERSSGPVERVQPVGRVNPVD